MTRQKTLIVGKSGQVATALRERAPDFFDLVCWGHDDVPLSDLRHLVDKLDVLKPDLIINAAAYTAVDKAETEHQKALLLNATLPGVLADWCSRQNRPLVHYSTDYVFSGEGVAPHKERDPVAPINFYGLSKAKGEEAILQSGAAALILRTSWVYTATHPCFFTAIVQKSLCEQTLRVVDDQIGAPTPAYFLADVTFDLVHPDAPFTTGVLHAVPSGFVSWYGFTQKIVEGLKSCGVDLSVTRIIPVKSDAFSTVARRPKNSRLDNTLLVEKYGRVVPTWQDSLENVVCDFAANY